MSTLSSIGLSAMLAAAAAGCTNAYADDRRDPRRDYAKEAGSAAPSASAPPAAPATEGDGGTPWAPSFETSFPEEASPAPTSAEWKTAAAALEARVTEPACKVQRVREWYRIKCSGMKIEMISGQREGVSFVCPKSFPDSDFCDNPEVRFPARRGDRRAFQVLGWSKWGPDPNSFVTEQFIEGDPTPLVSVHGIHWGF